jgi:hypothetical protein
MKKEDEEWSIVAEIKVYCKAGRLIRNKDDEKCEGGKRGIGFESILKEK